MRSHVTRNTGLLSNEVCYYGSVRVAADGAVHYGSCGGLSIYDPSLDPGDNVPPRPTIVDFKYQENNWGTNELLVRYAGLSFTSERDVVYRTRLSSYDDMWSAPTSDHRFRFTNLGAFFNSKTYEFEVQASNTDGIWSTVPAVVSGKVLPPGWFGWWALALWGIGVVAAAVAVDKFSFHDQKFQ